MCHTQTGECTDVPVDVEDSDEGVLFDIGDEGLVNVLHNPVEELCVDMFGQRVTGVGGLQPGDGLDIRLRGRLQLPVAQPLSHVLVGHAYQLAECRQVAIVGLQEKDLNHEQEKPNKMSAEKMWIPSFRLIHKTC